MIQRIITYRLNGLDAVQTVIECQVSDGIGIHLVGLCDEQTKESLLRVCTALTAAGYKIPGRKIIINITPSELCQRGAYAFDLPIALAILIASGQVKPLGEKTGESYDLCLAAAGELALDGTLRPIKGTVSMVQSALMYGIRNILIPSWNKSRETDLVWKNGDAVVGINSLAEAVSFIEDGVRPEEASPIKYEDPFRPVYLSPIDMRSIEIAAAGGHGLLLVGEGSVRKVRMAHIISQLLPVNILENAKVASACGTSEILTNPCRTPNHSVSLGALVGSPINYGEVVKANRGVLCIDECDLMPKSTQLALRSVIADKKVTLSYMRSQRTLPADFLPVLAGSSSSLAWNVNNKREYLKQFSGPLYDELDMQQWTVPDTAVKRNGVLLDEFTLEEMKDNVKRVRELQRKRFAEDSITYNAEMTAKHIDKYCKLTSAAKDCAERMMTKEYLGLCTYRKALKIARTIADMNGHDLIADDDLMEAAGYRFMDVTV